MDFSKVAYFSIAHTLIFTLNFSFPLFLEKSHFLLVKEFSSIFRFFCFFLIFFLSNFSLFLGNFKNFFTFYQIFFSKFSLNQLNKMENLFEFENFLGTKSFVKNFLVKLKIKCYCSEMENSTEWMDGKNFQIFIPFHCFKGFSGRRMDLH